MPFGFLWKALVTDRRGTADFASWVFDNPPLNLRQRTQAPVDGALIIAVAQAFRAAHAA